MDDRERKEKCIMGNVQDPTSETQGQPASMNIQNSITAKEENCIEFLAEKEREKGTDEGELKKEIQLKAEVKVELRMPVQDLQMNFIGGTELFGYVGIEAVLDQIRSKTMKAGFEFNLMVVGKSHTN